LLCSFDAKPSVRTAASWFMEQGKAYVYGRGINKMKGARAINFLSGCINVVDTFILCDCRRLKNSKMMPEI